MSQLGGSDISGDGGSINDVSEVEPGSEISEIEMDDELSRELDDTYDSYMEKEKEFESNFNEAEEKEEPEHNEDGLSDAEKEQLKAETGWSDEIVDSTRSLKEAEIYKNADLKEAEIDGKKCLIRSDIDMELKDEFGRTNKERMELGNAPYTESGEKVELHHIGQKQDSPLAELTMQEHRGKGNDTILHDKQKETEIDRAVFDKERQNYWESRAANI